MQRRNNIAGLHVLWIHCTFMGALQFNTLHSSSANANSVFLRRICATFHCCHQLMEMDEMAVESCRTLFLIIIMITPFNQNHKPRMSSIGSAKLKSQHLIRDGCVFHSSLSASHTCHIFGNGYNCTHYIWSQLPFHCNCQCWLTITTSSSSLSPAVSTFMVSCLQHLLLYEPFFISRKVSFCLHHCRSRCHFAGSCMVR